MTGIMAAAYMDIIFYCHCCYSSMNPFFVGQVVGALGIIFLSFIVKIKKVSF